MSETQINQETQKDIEVSSFYTNTDDDENIKQVQNWLKAWKRNKYLPASNLQITDQVSLSRVFKLTLININNLNFDQEKAKDTEKLGIRFYCNFFSNQVKQFFGRTYESELIPVYQTETNNIKFKEPEPISFYYHTQVNHQSSSFIILEVILYQFNSKNEVLSQNKQGFFKFPMLQATQDNQLQKQIIYLGKPKDLKSGIDIKQQEGQSDFIEIHYVLKESNLYEPLRDLVPDSVVLASNELIPGLKDGFLPAILKNEKQIQMEDNYIIKIEKIEFEISNNFDEIILNDLKKSGEVFDIQRKRFVVAFHNSWKCLNMKGLCNSQGLQTQIQEKSTLLVSDKPLYVDGINFDENCILIVQLEYEIVKLDPDKGNDISTIVFGWLPHSINKYLGNEFEISGYLITNYKTVNGIKLHPIKDLIKVTIEIDGTNLAIEQTEQTEQTDSLGQEGAISNSQVFELQQDLYEFQMREYELINNLEQIKFQNQQQQLQTKEEIKVIKEKLLYNKLKKEEEANKIFGIELPQEELAQDQVDPITGVTHLQIPGDLQRQNIINQIIELNFKNTVMDDFSYFLDKEIQDFLQGNYIQFHINQITPYKHELPTKIILQTSFFNFSRTNSDVLNQTILENGEQKYLTQNKSEYSFQFQINPKQSQIKDLNVILINYLWQKFMHIDVLDGNTLMHFGFVKLSLRYLLRQGEQVKEFSNNFLIVDPNFKSIKGFIKITMHNQGFEALSKDQEIEQKQIKKNKVVSSYPLSLPKQFYVDEQHLQRKNFSEEERKKEKIKQFKLKQIHQQLQFQGGTELAEKIIEQNKKQMDITLAKYKNIDEIDCFKQQKKDEYIKNVITDFFSEAFIVESFIGATQIIPITYKNNDKKLQDVLITIQDPDSRHLQVQECSLIYIASEWEFWVQKLQLPQMQNYKIIKNNHFLIESGQTLTILFKFLTYRQVDQDIEQYPNIQEILSKKDDEYFQKYIRERNISIFFMPQNTKSDTKVYKLKIIPLNNFVDHTFKFYEKENKYADIIIPVLFLSPYQSKSIKKPYLYISNMNSIVSWLNEKEISIKLKVPSQSQTLKLNLYVYTNSYRSDLIANQEIDINSYMFQSVYVLPGQKVNVKLRITQLKKYLQLFSSNNQIIEIFKNVPFIFDKVGDMSVIAQSNLDVSQNVFVHCMDITNNLPVQQWFIRVDTENVPISIQYDITTFVDEDKEFVFDYMNQDTQGHLFYFECNDDKLIKIVTNQQFIEGGFQDQVLFKVVKQESHGIAEAIFYIYNESKTIMDYILFKITYVYKN